MCNTEGDSEFGACYIWSGQMARLKTLSWVLIISRAVQHGDSGPSLRLSQAWGECWSPCRRPAEGTWSIFVGLGGVCDSLGDHVSVLSPGNTVEAVSPVLRAQTVANLAEGGVSVDLSW